MKIHGIGTLLLKLLVMNMLSFFFASDIHEDQIWGGWWAIQLALHRNLFFLLWQNLKWQKNICNYFAICWGNIFANFKILDKSSHSKRAVFQKSMVILRHWCIFCHNKFCQHRKRGFISSVHLLFASWYLAVLLMLY